MSHRRWLPYITAVGIALVLAGAVHAQPIGDDTGDRARASTNQDAPQSNAAPLALESIKNEIERIARALESSIDKPKPAEEEEHADRDLLAQERMAWWAMWTFFAALASVVLTIVAAFLLWRTLVYTKSAADAAIDAAKHGRTAAIAATHAVGVAVRQADISQDTAERQLRAYVSVASKRRPALKIGAIPEARLVVQNHGQTPAYNAWTWVAGRVMEADAALDDAMPSLPPGKEFGPGSKTTIHYGQEIGIRGHASHPLTTEEWQSILQDEFRFFVWGEVHYLDAFKKRQVTKFRLDIDAETIRMRDATMRHCEKGNDAT
jgi:negative regulator of sigma E activity